MSVELKDKLFTAVCAAIMAAPFLAAFGLGVAVERWAGW